MISKITLIDVGHPVNLLPHNFPTIQVKHYWSSSGRTVGSWQQKSITRRALHRRGVCFWV